MIGFLLTSIVVLLWVLVFRIIDDNTVFIDFDWECEDERHL